MAFSKENGYVPVSVETMMTNIMTFVNPIFETGFTYESFVGSNFYKFYYALIQRVQQGEIKTAEIFAKLQQYFIETNSMISRPVATNPGLIQALETAGYISSVKPMVEVDAGKLSVAVQLDSGDPGFAADKAAVGVLLSQSIAAGIVTQGTQTVNVVLSNGQAFDWKFFLPDIQEPLLRLTLTTSENNQLLIGDPDDVKIKLLNQIAARYRLGRNFEPQRYFQQSDAPWTAGVLLEYSLDSGTTWTSAIFDAQFDDLFDIKLENIVLVEV